MGHSSSKNNFQLIDELCDDRNLLTMRAEMAFRLTDRARFLPKYARDKSYGTEPVRILQAEYPMAAESNGMEYLDDWRNWTPGPLHLSAPNVYAIIIENLDIRPRHRFLNIGSGSGYLSSIAGFLIGDDGVNHGLEMHENLVAYAKAKNEEALECPEHHAYPWCKPKYYNCNAMCSEFLSDTSLVYDRIYCGASLNDENAIEKLLRKLAIDGNMIVPTNGILHKYIRVSEERVIKSTLIDCSFAQMVSPEGDYKPPELPPAEDTNTLRHLTRSAVLKALRSGASVDHELYMKYVNERRNPLPAIFGEDDDFYARNKEFMATMDLNHLQREGAPEPGLEPFEDPHDGSPKLVILDFTRPSFMTIFMRRQPNEQDVIRAHLQNERTRNGSEAAMNLEREMRELRNRNYGMFAGVPNETIRRASRTLRLSLRENLVPAHDVAEMRRPIVPRNAAADEDRNGGVETPPATSRTEYDAEREVREMLYFEQRFLEEGTELRRQLRRQNERVMAFARAQRRVRGLNQCTVHGPIATAEASNLPTDEELGSRLTTSTGEGIVEHSFDLQSPSSSGSASGRVSQSSISLSENSFSPDEDLPDTSFEDAPDDFINTREFTNRVDIQQNVVHGPNQIRNFVDLINHHHRVNRRFRGVGAVSQPHTYELVDEEGRSAVVVVSLGDNPDDPHPEMQAPTTTVPQSDDDPATTTQFSCVQTMPRVRHHDEIGSDHSSASSDDESAPTKRRRRDSDGPSTSQQQPKENINRMLDANEMFYDAMMAAISRLPAPTTIKNFIKYKGDASV